MEILDGRKVLLTGASGFLGKRVAAHLHDSGALVIPVHRKTGYDLTREVDAYKAVIEYRPDIIIHLAAKVGGIIANMAHPASFFNENMQMGLNIVNAAHLIRARVIVVGTICSYPKNCPVPFKEEDFWYGFPEETNAPYGIAKKALLVMLQAYQREHDLRFGYLAPTNLYGPEDNFDEKFSHVIPAMIKRFIEAKRDGKTEVTLFGTGKVTRSFLYVEDAAEVVMLAAAKLDHPDVVNLPGSPEISMSELGSLIAKVVGYSGSIVWDPSKPDGQPRRFIDGTRVKELLGWAPSTALEEGLQKTVNWYLKNK
jgi:GDP-L-fucose synthase